jgi:Asp-tRNA(Asn)/Glu-tRNA(Gln) amidotransferase A subunit family amidase
MNASDYLAHDAVGLAQLIARREVSAAEVLEAALAQSERVNGKLNAIVLSMADEARPTVREGTPPGPLGGVPFLMKDIGAQVKGVPTSAGSRLLKDKVAAADSAIVTAYRRAGLVIFGKTNTPEFGLEPVTEPELFGPSRNPWNLERTPGGSSGGSAAAVAAGIVPAAHASDGGGSIRIPASCCGLFGMKPSRGRVSFAPLDEGWGGLSIQNVVTRSVRDGAALLDAVSHPVAGDPYWAPPPAQSFIASAGRDPGVLRIGFTTAALVSESLDPECAQAVRDAAALCERLGHQVEEANLPGDAAAASAAAGVIVAANIAAVLDAEGARRGSPVGEGEIEALTAGVYERGKQIAAPAYIHAIQAAHAYGRSVAPFFERYDVLLLSTLGRPPVPLGWLRGDPPDMHGYNRRLFDFMPNTQAFNLTGAPAMTVPLAWSGDGLPIGVQFVGRPADEATLFSLAGQLERAQPWAAKRPAGL